MREGVNRSNFFGVGLPILIVIVLGIVALTTSRTAITGAWAQARSISIKHTFDEGVSVWNVRLR